MIRQQALFGEIVNTGDIVYTQESIAKGIISFLNPSGLCLDPCKGDGVFYNNFPTEKDYCEIREGKDFFDYSYKVDWIIGNPPYSIFKDFLEHSFALAENVSFLVPTNKIWQRQVIMDMINEWGGVKSIMIYGSGTLIGFPFGFSVGNFHFQKNYKGKTQIVMGIKLCTKP